MTAEVGKEVAKWLTTAAVHMKINIFDYKICHRYVLTLTVEMLGHNCIYCHINTCQITLQKMRQVRDKSAIRRKGTCD